MTWRGSFTDPLLGFGERFGLLGPHPAPHAIRPGLPDAFSMRSKGHFASATWSSLSRCSFWMAPKSDRALLRKAVLQASARWSLALCCRTPSASKTRTKPIIFFRVDPGKRKNKLVFGDPLNIYIDGRAAKCDIKKARAKSDKYKNSRCHSGATHKKSKKTSDRNHQKRSF